MNKKIIILSVLVVLVAGGLYLKKIAECFAGTGGVTLPQVTEVNKGEDLVLPFKMLRIAAPGCLSGNASDSYKNVTCGFRIGETGEWTTAHLLVKSDAETAFDVECQIPAVPADTAVNTKLEYYFEYSAWGKPAERKTGSLTIK